MLRQEEQDAINAAVEKGIGALATSLDAKLDGLTKPQPGGRPALQGASEIDQGRVASLFGVYRYARHFQGDSRRMGGGNHRTIAEKVEAGDTKLAERMLNWMRAFAVRDVQGMVAAARANTATDSSTLASGGALVPTEFAQDVIELLGQMTPLATTEFLRVIPMTSERMIVPRVTVRPKASYGTQGSTDTTGQQNVSFGEIELIAREAWLLVGVDEKWLADISIDGVTYLTELFAEVLAELRNQMLIHGSGIKEPEGVLTNTDVPTVTYSGSTDKALAKFVTTLYAKVKPRYRRNGLWLTSTAGYAKLLGLQDDLGRFLLQQLQDEPFARMMGKPVFETEAISDTEQDSTHTKLLFGNFKYYVFGDRQQMEARTDNGGTHFDARQVAIRVLERYDGKVGQPVAFAKSINFPNS